MSDELLTTIITVVLGGGGIAALQAAIRGWSSLRAGARAREREAVDDLAAARDAAADRAAAAERDRDFWRVTSARYAAQLLRAGHEPVPPDPVPPSER